MQNEGAVAEVERPWVLTRPEIGPPNTVAFRTAEEVHQYVVEQCLLIEQIAVERHGGLVYDGHVRGYLFLWDEGHAR